VIVKFLLYAESNAVECRINISLFRPSNSIAMRSAIYQSCTFIVPPPESSHGIGMLQNPRLRLHAYILSYFKRCSFLDSLINGCQSINQSINRIFRIGAISLTSRIGGATVFMEFHDYIARNDELLEILLH